MSTFSTTALPLNTPPKTMGKLPRVDGPLKVTGAAMYSSDYNLPGMLYAVPVCATVPSGKITALDASVAEKMPGVKAVYSHGNIGNLYRARSPVWICWDSR